MGSEIYIVTTGPLWELTTGAFSDSIIFHRLIHFMQSSGLSARESGQRHSSGGVPLEAQHLFGGRSLGRWSYLTNIFLQFEPSGLNGEGFKCGYCWDVSAKSSYWFDFWPNLFGQIVCIQRGPFVTSEPWFHPAKPWGAWTSSTAIHVSHPEIVTVGVSGMDQEWCGDCRREMSTPLSCRNPTQEKVILIPVTCWVFPMTGQIVFNGKGLRPDLQAGGSLDAFYSPKWPWDLAV